jgi:hypothetical protein
MQALLSLFTSTTGSMCTAQAESTSPTYFVPRPTNPKKDSVNDIKASLRSDIAMLFLVNLSLAIDLLPEGFLPFNNLPTNCFCP